MRVTASARNLVRATIEPESCKGTGFANSIAYDRRASHGNPPEDYYPAPPHHPSIY